MKTCRKCNKEKDESCFVFRVDSGKLRNDCRECVKKMLAEYKSKMSSIQKVELASKKCLDCNNVKESRYFSRNKYAVDGRSPYCLSCNNARTSQYRKDNPDKMRESARRSVEKHKDKIVERRKIYRSSPKHKAYKKAWYEANRHWYAPHLQEKHKKNMLNDEKYRSSFRAYMKEAAAKRRALKARSTYVKMSESGLKLLLSKADDKCLKCGSVVDICVDHVMPVSKGGSSAITNYQPLCKSCDSSKHAKFVDYRPWTMDLDEIGLDTNCYAH